MNALVAGFLGVIMGILGFFGLGPQVPVVLTPQAPRAASESLPAQKSSDLLSEASSSREASAGQTFAPANSPSQETAGSASLLSTAQASALPTGSPYRDSLPLGDGKYTTAGPKQGYIYVCNVMSGGQGAQGTPSWIHGSTWDPSEKVAVEGNVSWPQASYSMSTSGSTRYISANGLPTDHTTGIFPIESSDPAYQYDHNPNSIAAQSDSLRLPAYPSAAASPGCIYGRVGVMTDGVPLLDGFDAEYRDAVAHETQDSYEGHPDERSEYHYHGFEAGPLDEPVSTVVGFAYDGYPITGGKLPDGNYITTAELDECHGMTSQVDLDGKEVTTYHYVLTQDFPYSVGCFHGTSYEPKPGGGSGQTQAQPQGPGTGMPPPPRF